MAGRSPRPPAGRPCPAGRAPNAAHSGPSGQSARSGQQHPPQIGLLAAPLRTTVQAERGTITARLPSSFWPGPLRSPWRQGAIRASPLPPGPADRRSAAAARVARPAVAGPSPCMAIKLGHGARYPGHDSCTMFSSAARHSLARLAGCVRPAAAATAPWLSGGRSRRSTSRRPGAARRHGGPGRMATPTGRALEAAVAGPGPHGWAHRQCRIGPSRWPPQPGLLQARAASAARGLKLSGPPRAAPPPGSFQGRQGGGGQGGPGAVE